MTWSAALILLTLAHAGDASVAPIEGALRTGHPLQAAEIAGQLLATAPDHVDALVLRATAWSRAGLHGDALGAFALCDSGDAYERYGLDAHANSLRATGRGLEAAALRSEQLVLLADDTALALLYVDLSDDLALLAPTQALEQALIALSSRPGSPQVHAALSERYLELGDSGSARAHAAASDAITLTLRGLVAQSRVALAEGDAGRAWAILEEADALRVRPDRLLAARLETRRRLGDLDAALAIADAPAARYTQHPELMAAALRAARDAGDAVLWRELVERSVPVADHPLVRAALQEGSP